MSDKVVLGDDFEQLVLRVWRGKLMGATDDNIRAQLISEGIAELSITQALTKANRSAMLSAMRMADSRGDT